MQYQNRKKVSEQTRLMIFEMLFTRELKPKINKQFDSNRAKLFI